MKLLESISIALKSLLANKLRSTLTMLGIIIGVGAVISLMSIGKGAQAQVTSTIQELGSNVLYIMPRSPEVAGLAGFSGQYSTPSLTLGDSAVIERIPGVAAVAPVNENFVEVTNGAESKTVVVHGMTPAYFDVYKYSLADGAFISEHNVLARDMVVVLGSEAARDLFGDDNPVQRQVKIKGHRFTVVGVLAPKGGAVLGVSMDSIVLTPLTTFQTRLFTQRTAGGDDSVQSIAVKVADAGILDSTQQQIEDALRRRRKLLPDDKSDFAVVSQEQVLGIFSQITGIFTIFLGSIAGISLVVGGIGIMNIMLVSVTERTREIGIRKAVGAKRRDILFQFLLESAALSLVGGAVGIVGGWLVATAVSQLDLGGFGLKAFVSPDIVLLAVSVSVIIGLVSGIYPAMRAARLNPIDALHYG